MKTVLALRHVAFEDLGGFAPVFARRGYTIEYLEAGVDNLARPAPYEPDILVILGGPIGVNDAADYPFIRDELDMLARRAKAGRPTLGICLGAQLMARALGARVYPAKAKEVGWAPIRLTDEGRRSSLAALAPNGEPVLHWHGDTFDLPEEATRLASTDICPNQAFAWGSAWLALQFHAETTRRGLEQWFIGHTVEIAATPGVSVGQLRADTARWGASLETRGAACLERWLDAVETIDGG
ncbi:MAG: glutamine amidotransferase [Alphaproteobacteria bacterium]|nr:glutamine amidotransferase [Alphaproteobacteria bacterium]MBM3733780.1 glutamine amidotransferase [Acidimicrobiia bacterium]MBM3950548.1 glutamine amidotransferase [Rhodospirillales bacterium]